MKQKLVCYLDARTTMQRWVIDVESVLVLEKDTRSESLWSPDDSCCTAEESLGSKCFIISMIHLGLNCHIQIRT